MLAKWNYQFPEVWNEMSRLSKEMEQIFGHTDRGIHTGVFPPLNLFDDGDNLTVTVEVPGVDLNTLEVTATANTLSLKGERVKPDVEQNVAFHRQERRYGTFSRSITLPVEINPDKVKAGYKNGILEVVLSKAEETKPKKIKISA
jgi:HSP20 family protein